MTTNECLINGLEAALEEQPDNKALHRSIGSVINRFFKSKDNSMLVNDMIKSEPFREKRTNQASSLNNSGYSVWNGPTAEKKASPLPTYRPKPVVGRGIEETMQELEPLAPEVGNESEEETLDDNISENDFTGQDTGNELLDMTTEKYLEVYGGLANLKKFADQTLGLDFPKNASADRVVELIKQKIVNEEADNS